MKCSMCGNAPRFTPGVHLPWPSELGQRQRGPRVVMLYQSVLLLDELPLVAATSMCPLHIHTIYNSQRLQKLIYLYLSTACFMNISLQSSSLSMNPVSYILLALKIHIFQMSVVYYKPYNVPLFTTTI